MAAGLGTRMRSAVPKHLHPLLGRRMVDWVLAAAQPLSPDPLVVVTSPDSQAALADVEGVRLVVQPEPRGTGDAVVDRTLRARRRARPTSSSSPATRRS